MAKLFDISKKPKDDYPPKNVQLVDHDKENKNYNILLVIILIILAALFVATFSTSSLVKIFNPNKKTESSDDQNKTADSTAAQTTSTETQKTDTSSQTTAANETAQPTTQPSQTPSATTSEIDKASYKIRVLNGTTTNGLAAKIKEQLEKDGWQVTNIGNAKNRYQTTVIYYKGDKEAAAKAVAQVLADRETSVKQSDSLVGASYDILVAIGTK